jgi:hypothetical protein
MRAATKFDRDRLCLQPSCLIVCRGIPGTRCIAFSKAQFCRRGLSHLDRVCRSCWRGLRSKARDERLDVFELPSRHPALGHLKDGATAMANHLCADLDQLLPQAGQRRRLPSLRHRQRPHEIAELYARAWN